MYTLLTGATGLVGRFLVRDLLLNGHQLAVVVRPSRRQSPRDRMEEILQHWERELGRSLPRPVVLNGDITEPGFGLNSDDREWVRRNCNRILHSAAILEFHGSDRNGEPWRTNLGGTQNMIALCRELNIRDIHYVSTAYVAGCQNVRVMESSLDAGQSFRNDYEASKFEAECLVRAIDFADHVTVYRPAVISGDSVTGYTNTYHGIYLYLRLMALVIPTLPPLEDGRRHTPIRLRMTGHERRNVVPVDYVSAVMCRLFETPEARGLTFHIAPIRPITSGEIIQWCGDYFNSFGAEFIGQSAVAEPDTDRETDEDQWFFERLYKENAETYEPYERTDNVFDMTNTLRFAGDIPCPEIDSTIIHRYIDFGNEDRWGKRKPESQPVAAYLEDVFRAAVGASSSSASRLIGLDLAGPGGCQLSARISPAGLESVEPGLPAGDGPVLKVDADEFLRLLEGDAGNDGLRRGWEGADPEEARMLSDMLVSALQREAVPSQA